MRAMTDKQDEITEVGFLRDIEIHDHAEDVKGVQIAGDRGTVEFQVTDETMNEFLEAAEDVHNRIHDHMADMKDVFDREPEDGDDT